MHEERLCKLQSPRCSMMPVDKDVSLNDLTILRKKDVAHDPRNARIDVGDVVPIHVARLDCKGQIVWVQLHRHSPVRNHLSRQIDVENKPTSHIQKLFFAMLPANRTASFRDPLRHEKALTSWRILP